MAAYTVVSLKTCESCVRLFTSDKPRQKYCGPCSMKPINESGLREAIEPVYVGADEYPGYIN